MKKALICGISGQDVAYLVQLLLQKGYRHFRMFLQVPAKLKPNERITTMEAIEFVSERE